MKKSYQVKKKTLLDMEIPSNKCREKNRCQGIDASIGDGRMVLRWTFLMETDSKSSGSLNLGGSNPPPCATLY